MLKDEKDIFLNGEADAWFTRNYKAIESRLKNTGEPTPKYSSILSYLKGQGYGKKPCKILEVGCSFGYNLSWLKKQLLAVGSGAHIDAYGVEPSKLAVEKAAELYGDSIQVIRGTSDMLPFADESFDVCILGFCMFWVDRRYLFRSVAETDRVLKSGGHLIVVDFDTKTPYMRTNIHNADAFTYKMQYDQLFLANPQYTLARKECYSHSGQDFTEDVQERLSMVALYKDTVENAYIKD